jgi:Ca2+-binding RTX toxin-like protein
LTISGNGGGDTIIGSPNDDVIFGGSGDDSLSGNGGFDTILGGSGLDIVTESAFTSMLVTSTGLTIGRAVTGVETDSLDSIETIVGQGAGGNEFFGFTGFIPGLTSITFAGGAGASDIAGFSWNGTLTATNTTVTMTGAPAINISGMERLILIGGTGNDILDASAFTGLTSLGGGDGNDVLIGGNGVDTLVGGEGNDTLSGRGGNDALDGGNGDDTYLFDTDNVLGADTIADSGGIDTLDFSTSALGNTVNLTLLANPVNANLSLSWLAGVSLENIIGGAGADSLTGSAGPNVLTGGGNNDTLSGGAGDDTYIFDVDGALGSDTVTDSGGIDTFDFSSTTTAANLSLNLTVVAAQVVNANLTLTLGASVVENVTAGAGNDTITGNGSDNILIGGAGTDILIGNNGADTLNGGAGNDTLTGGAGNDTYVYNAGVAQGTDTLNDASGVDTLDFSSTFALGVTVDLALTTAQTVQAANLTITLNSATAFENVIGGGGNDVIRGNSIANVFTGGAGSDTLIGVGAGDSISEIRDANFLLVDLTASTASLTIGAELDALTNIHTAVLTGGNSANIIDVRDFTGTATLNGGAGNDTFYGGGGTMNFAGGTGDDTYVFDRSVNSVNTITEGSGLLDDLHDTIMGAGGGLVNLISALLQTPDAAYPNFKIQFTIASTVEHSL